MANDFNIDFDATLTIPVRISVSLDKDRYQLNSAGRKWDVAADISSSLFGDALNEVRQVTPHIPSTLQDTLNIADNIEVRDSDITVKIEGETNDIINDVSKELFEQQERWICIDDDNDEEE